MDVTGFVGELQRELEDTYSDYAGDGRFVTKKCFDLSVKPGWQRLIVEWTNSGCHGEECEVSWSASGVKRDTLLNVVSNIL